MKVMVSVDDAAARTRKVRDLRVVETECGFCLVDRDLARDLGDVAIEWSSDVVVVTEDERLLQLETNCDDIPSILPRKLVRLLDLQLVLEQELLVVRQLHDQRDVEHVLQPSAFIFAFPRQLALFHL